MGLTNWFKKQPKDMSESFELLSALLSREDARKEFLGFSTKPAPTPQQKEVDVKRALEYTQSNAFEPVAKEIWAQAIRYIDLLSSATTSVETGSNLRRPLTQEEINFTRGCLKQALDTLSLAYKAQLAVEELNRRKEGISSTPNGR